MKPAARFKDDVDTLTFLLDGPVPKKVHVRLETTGCVHYGIGDASGDGYGAAVHIG